MGLSGVGGCNGAPSEVGALAQRGGMPILIATMASALLTRAPIDTALNS